MTDFLEEYTLQNTKCIVSKMSLFFSIEITFADAKHQSVDLKPTSVLDAQNKYQWGSLNQIGVH